MMTSSKCSDPDSFKLLSCILFRKEILFQDIEKEFWRIWQWAYSQSKV